MRSGTVLALFHQLQECKKTVEEKRRLGVEAFLEVLV
jgi:hypothetical protein